MISNLFNRLLRPINAWITTFVIVLHGLSMWALISMDSPERSEIKRAEPKSVQLQLVTLVTLPVETPRIENKLKSQLEPPLKQQPEKEVAKPIEKIKSVLEPIRKLEHQLKNEPLNPIKEQLTLKNETMNPVSIQEIEIKNPEERSEDEQSLVALVQAMTEQLDLESADISVQELVIKESRKIVKTTAEQEQDIAALIRAVTKQFNRDQANQQREAKKQVNRKRAEQDGLQATADNKPVNFLAEKAIWLDEHEPNVNLPLLVWRSTNARSGDIFTVLLELYIDKDGYITEVQLLESSGNQVIDATATVQVRSGQLHPLQQDGMPVNGIVPMSLSYEMP